jgi:hypothetical protein
MTTGFVATAAIVIIILTLTRPAAAQNGACPDYTSALGPVPGGTHPGASAVCTSGNGDNTFVVSGPQYPCGGGIQIHAGALDDWPSIQLAPPAAQPYPTGVARVRFQASPATYWGGQPSSDVLGVMRSYDSNGYHLQDMPFNLRDYPSRVLDMGGIVYLVEDLIFFEQGGYIEIHISDSNTWTIDDIFFFNWQIEDSAYPMPEVCNSSSWPTPTPTNSPTPSQTPTPTETPSITPTATTTPTITPVPSDTPTQWPTSDGGGGETPAPTVTPYNPATVPAEPTGTELPPLQLPDVSLPSLSVPSVPEVGTPSAPNIALTPNATTQANATAISGWISDTEQMYSGWITSTKYGLSWLDPDGVGATDGISTPVQIADQMVGTIAQPISAIRGLSVYIPNIWPYLFLIFLMLIWIFFNLLVRFGIAIVGTGAEILRRVWEAIPFVN